MRLGAFSRFEGTVYLSIADHGMDQEVVVREFILEFVDHPPFGMDWARRTVAERRLIRRVWEGIVRKALVDGR